MSGDRVEAVSALLCEDSIEGPRLWPSKKDKLKAEVAELKGINQKLDAKNRQLEKEAELNELAIKQAMGELASSDVRLKELEHAAETLAKRVDELLNEKKQTDAKLQAVDDAWKDHLAEANEQARINLAVEHSKFVQLEAYVRRVEANLRAEHQAMLKWREAAKRTADAIGQMGRTM
jgi:chromosome segregation ATPase